MNVLVIIAHPNPDSFNFGLLARVQRGLESAGHCVRIRDLHAEPFNPVLDAQELSALQQGKVGEDVKREQGHLSWAQGVVIIYPLWWLDRPAILKGWFDRVLTHGFAFSYGDKGVEGLLTAEKALVVVTAGGGMEEFTSMGMTDDDLVKGVTVGTLGFCGVQHVQHKVFYQVPVVSDEERERMLDEMEALASNF